VIKIGILAIGILAIMVFAVCGNDDPLSSSSLTGSSSTIVTPATAIPKPAIKSAPIMSIDPSKDYVANMVTEKGTISIKLFAKEVPNTVNNFVHLSRTGFYDGVTFHRVLPGFMAQSGDPTGTGMGGPGYQFDDEFNPGLRHSGPGVLSMANSGQNTNGSQFFITFVETPSLDGLNPDGSAKDCANPYVSCHAVFGKVVEGMDVLGSISLRDPSTSTTPGDVIHAIEIEEDGVVLGQIPG
ncbi:uncharacterized protein METZ01_LOCUS286003, partial [marine metagenome]